MKAKRTKRQQAIIKRRIFLICCTVVLVAAIAAISGIAVLISRAFKNRPNNTASDVPPSSSLSSEEDKNPVKKSSATVINTGDIMVHSTQLEGAKTTDGYDFSAFFKDITEYVSKADLAVANLEVTFGSEQSGKYSGYPAFNTPDILADNIKSAGFDVMLTANNHCYDTGLFGLKRTVSVLKERSIDFTGTRETANDPYYIVKKVNGIKIGMVCYTYENKTDVAGRKSINGALISTEANDLINTFSYDRIDSFYTAAQTAVKDMKNDGADFVVFYMHWGEEYQLKQNTWQSTIAQKLCNMGVNMIIGGHPHVIQPVALLHSEDSQNTTVCLYSMGNAVSNQRQEIMKPECTTGHTEDGMLFTYTLDKYSDGSVVLSAVDIIPTWVNKYKGGSGYQYTIVPLDSPDDGTAKWGLSGTAAEKSKKSYERTKAIVGPGLTECQQSVGCPVRFSEAQ